MGINWMVLMAQIERANAEAKWYPEGGSNYVETKDREGLALLCEVLNISDKAAKGAYRLHKRFYKKNPNASISYEMKVFRQFLNTLDYNRPRIGFRRPKGFFARKCGHEVPDSGNGWYYHPTLGVIRFSK